MNQKNLIYDPYSKEHKNFLLTLARTKLESAFTNITFQEPNIKNLDPILKEPKAVFITLTKNSNLRGCIGTLTPIYPLYKAIIHGVISAAFEDPRFEPLKEDELKYIKIEISILTHPQALNYQDVNDLLSQLRPHVDGVILRYDKYSATFLPQVWDKLPNKEQFLSHLCLKAGLLQDTWKTNKCNIETYQVISFEEN